MDSRFRSPPTPCKVKILGPSRDAIRIGGSGITDALVRLLARRFMNAQNVYINEIPISLNHTSSLSDSGLADVGDGFKRLEKLKLDMITDASLAAVGLLCKSLEKLLVDLEFIHNKGLLAVAKGSPQLKSLRLQCRNLTDEALQAVGKFCQFLELLALYSFQNFTDKNLCAIGKGCKKLKNLTFIDCNFLSDIGLDSIAVGCTEAVTELMHLEVNGCQNIGTSRLQSIVKFLHPPF
ncbi:F-box/LRR-repeat protein 4 [Forsythia ovata]|uniref:F-box/LRR-repeat protein 4 n=1 Tax=Forsythia ovata TaxID=205694 RepID=A0ABD1UTG4_9LAMI